ncbi:glutamine amidotransferase-related protein [Chitinophaga nivalis]|uniref:Gamma-glutamyl-gamma-aminobutyrate hydrolase family protein n=1 Tax=Chitinophaga nivalis TaxID=2991709 RepID=A0ABT3IRU3_9BACT|nr:gamma-glutamyl-gamma-aminobutyrate hydrolase family protein [Chitinophaga nivalis]MCW3463608.1 gamma-glutamyl-gamma-aminobutyrate hydrolase family protein [Chitinophaga nivalis]MCW3486702.1 gamma-glutamyl-gamma-aminobutyrate hydrolase family protein [Chitinophaga nivalis]
MHIHCFQQVPFEGLGCMADWIKQKGHQLTYTRWYDTQPDSSAAAAADWFIIMGGPMGVYEQDQYPWMPTAITLIREAIAQNKKVLGICLGSQLIAAALDANVYPHTQTELGWYPIDFTFQDRAAALASVLPHRLNTFHFHGDTFDMPAGATRFAASAACSNQAFIYGDRVIGLQFHAELTPDSLQAMVDHGAGIIAHGGPFIQSAEKIRQHNNLLTENNRTLYRLLDYMEAL